MARKEVELKGEELERFKALYPNTANRAVAKMFGHSANWVRAYAERLGLEKSEEWMEDVRERRATRLADLNRRTRTGKTVIDFYGEERGHQVIAKGIATRKARMERDRKRIRLGLEPLTRMVAEHVIDRSEVCRRYRMRRIGYVTFRKDHSIYYTDETKRDILAESRCKAAGILIEHISRKR